MKPVIAPIIPDSEGKEVLNLQQILQLFVEREIIQIDKDVWPKMLNAFIREQRRQFYGEITGNLVVTFRIQHNLGDVREVDEATAKAINALLESNRRKRSVTGSVMTADSIPVVNIHLKVFHQEVGGEKFINESSSNSEGKFEIFLPDIDDLSKNGLLNLFVVAYNDTEEEIIRSKTFFNIPGSAVIEMVLPDQKSLLTEYERIVHELEPYLKGISLETATDENIDILSGNSRVPKEQIVFLRQAIIIASKYVKPVISHHAGQVQLLIPVPVFYAWFRQLLPTEPKLLFARPEIELTKYIVTAVNTDIIPEIPSDILQQIQEVLIQFNTELILAPGDGKNSSLGDVLKTIPDALPTDKQFIVATILKDKTNLGSSLREKLTKAGLEERQAIAVETTLAFQSFSNNFLPLIQTLQDDPEINSLKDLALKVNKENFTRKIIDKKAFPENENPETFANTLYNNLFQKEATSMLRNMLADDNTTPVSDAQIRGHVSTFLSHLPETFDIKTNSVYDAFKNEKAFEGIAPEHHSKIKNEIKSLQRITAISPAPEVVPALIKAGVTTSGMVSNMPEKQFIKAFSKHLGNDGENIARQVHVNATNAQIRNEQVLISLKESSQDTGIALLDKSMKNTNGHEPADEKNPLSWDLLFGDADFCECEECTSIYSAASYFVDLLQFLRNNNLDPEQIKTDPRDITDTPLAKLFDRRPDLKCLQLTCKNTNTILPYVDLVNEVMENYVVFKETKTFNIAEDETSGELLAQPHHTEKKAYELLKTAVYPFTLPYHHPIDATRVFLDSLETSRYELMNTFRSVRNPKHVLEPLTGVQTGKLLSPLAVNLDGLYDDFQQHAIDAEYLGLTEEEYVILTKEAFVTKDYWDQQTFENGSMHIHAEGEYKSQIGVRPVHEYYGYASEGAMLDIDENNEEGLTFVKKQFLKRTGIQYVELVEMLKTRCLNPNVPTEEALMIMNRIQLSYRFLQSLVNQSAGADKYAPVIKVITLLTNPEVLAKLNNALGLEDPCGSESKKEALKEDVVKKWVKESFEKVGKMIVLENGVQCIDGKLSTRGDNLVDTGYVINNCKIKNQNTNEEIGSIDKVTGLVTLHQGQTAGDWTQIAFTGNNGETGMFIKQQDNYYLIANKIETCNLNTVRLIHLDGTSLTVEEYDHFHRFIRLWRKSGWSINEIDQAIVAFSNNHSFEISGQLIHQLAAIKKIQPQTGLELSRLLTFWTNINTTGEKSLYKKLFLTHNLAAIDQVFQADENGSYLSTVPTEKINDHIPVLMAALNLKGEDIDAIIDYEKSEGLTIENVSVLYRYRLLSKLLGLRVTGLIEILPLFQDPFKNADAASSFFEQWRKIEESGFNAAQLNFIVKGLDDEKKPVALTKKNLLNLAKTLNDGLNAIEDAHQDLKVDPEILEGLPEGERKVQETIAKQLHATSELLKEKLNLLFDPPAVENITGVLEGTTVYATKSPVVVKDLLRPVPPQNGGSQDYEYLHLENYPLLARKMKYDSATGSLQVKGILTQLEKEGSSLFIMDDFSDFQTLVNRLTGSDPISKHLWNEFSANKNTLSDPATTTSASQQILASELNSLILQNKLIYQPSDFNIVYSAETKSLIDNHPTSGTQLHRLNRMLLEDAFPLEVEKNQREGFIESDFKDFAGLLSKLMSTKRTPVSQYLWNRIPAPDQTILNALQPDITKQKKALITVFNQIITGGVSVAANFTGITHSFATTALLAKNPTSGSELERLNRNLFEDAYPGVIRKNQRIGFNMIRQNLLPDQSQSNSVFFNSLANIEDQQKKLVDEVFNSTFHTDISFLMTGDLQDPADFRLSNGDGNTARAKRLKFAEIYLPFLRKELSHRLIISTLSEFAGLSIELTELLVTQILKAGTGSTSIYQIFEQLNKPLTANYNRWKASLSPSEDGEYTFIIKNSPSRPSLSIDGNQIDFSPLTDSPDDWKSSLMQLRAGQQYTATLYRTDPENLFWKTDSIPLTSLKAGFSFTEWDGYIIPPLEEDYTFIVKGSNTAPVVNIEGQPIQFTALAGSPNEWSSTGIKLAAGKPVRLTLTALKPENLYWKTSTSESNSLYSGIVVTGWEGNLIPAVEGIYNFIIKGSHAAPDLQIDDVPVKFTERNGSPGEWWSDDIKLQSGKVYWLRLPELNLENLYWKTATTSVTRIASTSLVAGNVETTTKKAFTQLQKATLLVKGFQLSVDEIQFLSDHAADFDDLNFNKIELKQFMRLEGYTRLRNSLPADKINILEFFKWTHHPNSSTLPEKIMELTGWKKEIIERLIDEKNFNLLKADLFSNEINLLKLQDALRVAQKINADHGLLFDWAKPHSDFTKSRMIADSIQHAFRALYNQEDWEKAVKPLNDKLRENQKNALIAYLLIQPDIMKWGVNDADGLFEFFLIDVQMDACMETSRIKQAISSVQLFVQRCFLGLEEEQRHSGIKPDVLDRSRWDWMQRYRVWEANRKIFLYPENWIESNLRDDKSAFFKELESELLQKDINKQNVEDALKAYLYKVEEVSNMEVKGIHIETESVLENNMSVKKAKKLHVFCRTRNAPYSFFYRYLDVPAGNWYPWEKMQIDIPSYDMEDVTEIKESFTNGVRRYVLNKYFKNVIGNGCYLTPFVWNGRLLIFFPQFMKKTKTNEEDAGTKSIKELAEDTPDSAKPIEYWEIKMAWSEYRNGKWTQKQVSTDAIYDIPPADGFWNKFNELAKARIKYADAKSKHDKALLDRGRKETRWQQNSNSSRADALFNTYATSWDEEIETNTVRNLAFTDVNKKHGELMAIDLPAPTSSIASYKFVPVIAEPKPDTDPLLGIKIFYKDPRFRLRPFEEKGVFEFNGSSLTTRTARVYTASNAIDVYTFHHQSGSIYSLQENGSFSLPFFNDEREATYTYYNYAAFSRDTIKFHHPQANKLLGKIHTQQLESFFKLSVEAFADKDDAYGGYDNDFNTQTANIYHELKRPYSLYNWELFFHTPMMIADALSKSQRFEDAMKWYHYVFNPVAEGDTDNRFWSFSPFQDINAKNILDNILNKLLPNHADEDISEWRDNPFKPHLVARARPVAYMKWVVMKYIDNLVAWGDYLFRQDTIESINQATQLYILANHILGPRPQLIPKRGKIKPQSYFSLLDKWDANSNAMSELEILMPFSSQTTAAIVKSNGVAGLANVFGFASASYFSIPNNPKLLGYWDTISDRLFKIRHCENIQGIFRKLPLFEPPIDPAILVKAAAQGLSIGSVLNDLNTPMPNYRFYYLLQKALELCAELKSMGNSMLSAIEKKDNETIALIRSRHESGMLNLTLEIKKQQLEEAQKNLEGLLQNRKSPEHRMKYYLQLIGEDGGKVPQMDGEFSEIANAIETPIDESGLKLIKYEKEDMDKANEASDWQTGIGFVESLASVLHAIPLVAADVKPFGLGAGASFGGSNLGQLTQAVARKLQIVSAHLSHQSSSAAKKGGFLRAMQDRVMQANAAGYEIKQIDKQILSQQIRIGIAKLEISNHQKLIENTREIEEFLKNKYSNEELYSWMKSSLNTLYHQVYSLAFELAKKAEKTYCFEKGLTNSNFIKAGYWDAGYNGLLAGEQLYVGLKQLEAAYQENRGYDFEITKHVSVRQISPMAILQLRQTGICEFSLPEVLFDIDYPGHYKRRIKSVSVSIPCIAGPYTSLNGTLRLLENKFRNTPIAPANGYAEKTDEADNRFHGFAIPIDAIATSSGQNDSGMFELNFKDERYLPFEGAGVISKWRFELPSFKQFDYDTISDLVIHIRYTSANGGGLLKSSAEKSVQDYLKRLEQLSREDGLFTVIEMKHDLPNEWHALKSKAVDIKLDIARLPYFAQAVKSKEIINITLLGRLNDQTGFSFPITISNLPVQLIKDEDLKLYFAELTGYTFNETFNLRIDATDLRKLENLIIIIKYHL